MLPIIEPYQPYLVITIIGPQQDPIILIATRHPPHHFRLSPINTLDHRNPLSNRTNPINMS